VFALIWCGFVCIIASASASAEKIKKF